MSEDQQVERRSLAYRGAGDAVARYTQGRPLRDLSLHAQGPGEDESRYRPVDLGSRARRRLELEILALWAGLLAEGRACWDDREPPGGWGPVREPLAALGRRVTRSDEENEAYLEWLRQRALGLLDLPAIWPAIEAVAEALLAEGTIGAGETAALIAGTNRARRRRSGIGGWLRDVR